MYLLGDFGVTVGRGRVTLGALPGRIEPTDLAAQGLPFYGGAIRYQVPVPDARPTDRRQRDRLLLELPALAAACAKVSAPGRPPQMMAWQPFRADVTDILPRDAGSDGRPELTVEVVLTRRNTFGPLHELPRRVAHYGPDNFVTTGDRWSDPHVLYPAGLLAAPVWVTATPLTPAVVDGADR